ARASVCNLITVVGNENERGAVTSVLDRLSITNPSRTLILLAQHTREADKLEAQVSAQERTETGHRVSTERVVLHAHGEPARHLASLAAPLLIPDLPVILWWPGRPEFDNPLFDDLCELADRLIVDTDEGFDDTDLTRLLGVARRKKARASIGDLNWARLIARRRSSSTCPECLLALLTSTVSRSFTAATARPRRRGYSADGFAAGWRRPGSSSPSNFRPMIRTSTASAVS